MKKEKIRLNIGCGINLVGGFINVDDFFTLEDLETGVRTRSGMFREANIPKGAKFVKANVKNLPFEDNYADYIETSDMIEHLPYREVFGALKEMHRVLKPGGEIRIETVNFDEIARLWVRDVANYSGQLDFSDPNCSFYDLREVVYGNQIGEGQFHKSAFNPFFMGKMMKDAGFKKIVMEIYPTGSPIQPKMLTQSKWAPGATCRVEEFIAIATK
jgi:SAM-dependent methyltransferase